LRTAVKHGLVVNESSVLNKENDMESFEEAKLQPKHGCKNMSHQIITIWIRSESEIKYMKEWVYFKVKLESQA
jgi:hypothetical protein